MTTKTQNLESLKNEQVLKGLVFPKYGFKGELVGQIKDGKRIAGIRVLAAGYWDVSTGMHQIAVNDAAKLMKMGGDELSSFVLFLIV